MKDIPGFEGKYAVTEAGQVWSYKGQRWLKPSMSRGYPMVNLTLGDFPRGRRGQTTGKQATQRVFRVHRLMHMTFFSDQSGVINHKDGDKLNNHISNLEVVTQKKNVQHAYASGLMNPTGLKGEKNPMAKLTDVQRDALVRRRLAGEKSSDLEREFGVSHIDRYCGQLGYRLGKTRRYFSQEERAEIVRSLEHKTYKQVSEEVGVSPSNLHSWRRKFLVGMKGQE
jgi:hypothetical protein